MENEKKLTRSSNRMNCRCMCRNSRIFRIGCYFIENSIYIGYILHRFRRSDYIYYPVDCHAGKKNLQTDMKTA